MKRRLLCLVLASAMAVLTGCTLAKPVRESAGADRWVGYYMVYEPRDTVDSGAGSHAPRELSGGSGTRRPGRLPSRI